MLKLNASLCLLLVSGQCFAQLSIPGIPSQGINALALSDKTLARTGIAVNENDLLTEQETEALKLTTMQRHEARVWGLTEEDEKRYVHLLQNRSRIYYKGRHLTPVDILGIHARTETERNHFATLAAAQEAQMVAKNIAWNNAFYKAYNHLFKGIPVVGGEFDPAPFAPAAYKPVVLMEGDTLYLFVNADEAIKTVLLMLIDAIETTANTRLHLLVLNSDDASLQLWANQQQIPRALVEDGRISLNHGELNFEALTLAKKNHTLVVALTRNWLTGC